MLNQGTARPGSLAGRIAVITGGTQGLGAVVAEAFKAGASGPVLCGRSRAKGESLAHEPDSGGCRALSVAADLASVADRRAAIAAADRTFGRCDILVNAAESTERRSTPTPT